MHKAHKVVIAASSAVILLCLGAVVGYAQAGGDLVAAFRGASRPTCPGPGVILTADVLAHGCTDPATSQLRLLPSWPCSDGRRLLGENRLYGFTGTAAVASTDTALDPGYAHAYQQCLGK